MRMALTLLFTALLAVSGLAQVRQLRSFDLELVSSREVLVPSWPDSLSLIEARDRSGRTPPSSEAKYGMDTDMIMDLIRTSVLPESFEDEGWMRLREGRLWVASGTAAPLDKVAAALSNLESALHRPIAVEIHRMRAADGLRAGVLSAKEAAKLLDGGTHPISRLELLPRLRGRQQSGEQINFLADYDVEVASDARIADPRVASFKDGQDVVLECAPAPDGRIVVRAVCRDSRLLSMKRQNVLSTGLGVLQIPTLATMVATGSAAVENGGALVVGVAREASDSLFVIRVRMDAQSATTVGNSRIIPVGLIETHPLRLRSLELPGPRASGDEDSRGGFDPDSESRLRIDGVMDTIRSVTAREPWEEGGAFMTYAAGNLCVGPKAVGDEVARRVAEMQAPLLESVALEMRVEVLDSEDAAKLARGGEKAWAEAAKSMGTVAYTSALPGDDVRLVLGQEAHYLKDHDVEIAQESTIADPIVSILFTGQALNGRFRLGSGDRLGFEGEFLAQLPVGPVESFDGNADDVGAIDLPRTTTWRQPLNATLRSGRWSLAGIAPLPGKAASVVVLARATK